MLRMAACCAMALIGTACMTPAKSEAELINPFGMHGPTFSHWLKGDVPHLWPEAEARFHVVAGTGAGWARQDFWWSVVEPRQGEFEWAAFDRAVEMYERHGMKLMVILCYSSAWSEGRCPDTEEERARFANYVGKMVERYQGRVIAWEIWNEPNIQPFWSPRPDPELYAKLLQAAYKAAKKADPDCVVLGGSLAGPDADFLAGMYEHGAKGHFDALSYHNYGQALDLAEEYNAIEHLRRVLRANGEPDKPIWHTESGFYTGPQGLSEADQAARLVRYSVGQLALGIERVCQLTVADWTDDPTHHDRSVYRGLTRANYHKKLSYAAYRTMTERLAYKRLVTSFRPAAGVRGFLFRGVTDADEVLVLWRDWDSAAGAVRLALDKPVLLMQTLQGDWRVQRSPDGTYELMLGREPLYVLDPGPRMRRHAALEWPNPLASKVSKRGAAELRARVRNTFDKPVVLHCRAAEEAAVAARSAAIAPGRQQEVTLTLDTSALAVGQRDWHWALRAADSGDEFVSGYRLVEVEPPLEMGFAALTRLDPARPRVPATVTYRGAAPVAAEARLVVGGQRMPAAAAVQLQPRTPVQVGLPVELKALDTGQRETLTFELSIGNQTYATTMQKLLVPCPPAPPDVVLDGDLGEWRRDQPTIEPAQLQWEYTNEPQPPGFDDLAVTGWLGWSPAGLYVALEVQDDVASPPTARAVWDGDSVQVGLDLAADAPPRTPYDDNDLEIEVGHNPNGEDWCYLGHCPVGWPQEQLSERLRCATVLDRAAGVYRYELLIPADLLVSVTELRPETVLGFSLLVNDNDGRGRAGWMELTPGIGMGKMPAEFGWLWLQGE